MNKTKPRLGILHYAAPPTIGGVESTIAAHARLFAEHGFAVKIIAGRGKPFDARVPVQIIPTLDSRHSFITQVNAKLSRGIVPSDFQSLTTAIRHALENAFADVDICIAHNALTLHKNLALTSALKSITEARRVRLMAWCHDFAWDDPVYASDLHPGMPWDLLRQKWDGVKYVTVSHTRRKEWAKLANIPEAEIAVVPPGLDISEFLGLSPTITRWAHDLHLFDAVPLLLLPARVTRRKNIELAIEITAALREHQLTPKLVVMGPLGPHNPANVVYLEELRALCHARRVTDAVIFLQEHGEVDDAMRRDLYLLADALLFTSEREGFGIPILEAGLMRLPIFCTDLPSFRESAREYAHYFTLDEAPSAIAARLSAELSRDARYQMKQRVWREYTWEHIFHERIEPLVWQGEG